MISIVRGTGLRRVPVQLALLLAASLTIPALLFAHIRLEASSPAGDEVLTSPPPQLRLLFSERIEGRYTRVTLDAPDGAPVTLGPVVFVDGSDREITVRVPPLASTGTYTVRWRTAGADGHVLEGSFAFTLAADDTRAGPHGEGATGEPPIPHEQHAHEAPRSVQSTSGAIGRGIHFLALVMLLGAVTFRVLLLPRLHLAAGTRGQLELRAWRAVAAGAVLLAAAAVLRLWVQSIALHGAGRAWSAPLLSIMLSDTSWGRAWLLQALLFAVLGMAIAWARPGRDRRALFIAVPASALLAAIPGLSGHAAGASGLGRVAIVNDAIHVAAVGAWLGTLGVLILVAVPLIRRLEPAAASTAADAVNTFSPLALLAAAVVAVTGVINAWMHMTAPVQLWSTPYGRTLLLKLALVGAVLAMGFINWRVVRPRLRDAPDLRRLRLTAGAELLLALLVLTVTAILTGLPRP